MSESLSYAFGVPPVSGVIRTRPEDFFVDEVLGFEPELDGEHVLLHIEKRNTNTQWLADQLARYAGIPKRDVSYAGLKDRNAVTRQWFSLGLAGSPEPEWEDMNIENVRVLRHARHRRKLRRGTLQGNRFELVIRELQGDVAKLETRLQQVAQQGVPNYFGEQRFGHHGANLQQAIAMFQGKRIKDRHKRSLYLSAARSFLFNELLSQRVAAGNWNLAIAGDVMLLAGSNSYFVPDEHDEDIQQRLANFDIHPSGCLWGKGESAARGQAAILEDSLTQTHPEYCRGLEQAGLKQERRSLRLRVAELEWDLDASQQQLVLRFFLPAGSYATTVLRELVQTRD
jgi:tRNA pseudouridine13 synthase